MKRLLLILLTIGALGLTGCEMTSIGGPPVTTEMKPLGGPDTSVIP